jgi:hypothetical protein
VSEEVSELDAWLEKAAPPPPPPPRLKVGAKVRILDWVDSSDGTALKWLGRMGVVVDRTVVAGAVDRWTLACEDGNHLTLLPIRLEVVP